MSDLEIRSKCAFCEKYFSKQSQLRRHENTHSTLKQYECVDCRKSFKLASSLRRHQLHTHEQVKRYKCTQCAASFAQRTNLEVHIQHLHPSKITKRRHIPCPQCCCFFTSKSTLNKHIKMRHNATNKCYADNITDPKALAEYVVAQLKTLEPNTLNKEETDTVKVNSTQELTLIERVKVEQSTIIDKLHPARHRKDIKVQTVKRSSERFAYVCEYCAKEFHKTYNLIRHLRTHTKFRPYSCEHCICCFATRTQLMEHKSRSHRLDEKTGILSNQHHCYVCDKNFTSMRKLDLHMKSHADTHTVEYKCPTCAMIFKNKTAFSAHNHKSADKELEMLKTLLPMPYIPEDKIRDHNVPSQLCNCPDCGLRCVDRIQLKRHQKCHIINRKYKCKICGSLYASRVSLLVHQKLHRPSKIFECSLCPGRKFDSKRQLQYHFKNDHEQTRDIKCVYCPAVFKNKSHCKSHMTTHLKQLLGSKEDHTVVPTTQQAEITVRSLNKVEFIATESFTKKQKQVNNSTSKLSVFNETPTPQLNVCTICLKSFKKPSDLTRHLRVHTKERPFVCETCNKSFKLKSTLDDHLKTHLQTNERRRVNCQVCGKLYASSKSLAVHLRLHIGALPFKCDKCGKSFRTSGHRLAHLKSGKTKNGKCKNTENFL